MRIKRTIAGILTMGMLVFLGNGVYGEEQLTLEEVCSLVTCREPSNITLRYDAEKYIEVPLPQAPYYYNGIASIAASETLYLEAVVEDGKFVKLDYVPDIRDSSATITFHFDQVGEATGEAGMLMTTHNPLSRALVYKALIHRAGTGRFSETSICPILPGISTYEHWPYPIIQLALTNFLLISEAEASARGCR